MYRRELRFLSSTIRLGLDVGAVVGSSRGVPGHNGVLLVHAKSQRRKERKSGRGNGLVILFEMERRRPMVVRAFEGRRLEPN